MAVTITKLDAPTNVQATLQEGGTLLPNTTYYVVVTARGNWINTYQPPTDNKLISEASEEISFTTTDSKKSAVITWTRPDGGYYFNVYMTKASGEYSETTNGSNIKGGHRCGRIGNNVTDEGRPTVQDTNTYTITVEGTLNTAYVMDTIGYGALHDPQNPLFIIKMDLMGMFKSNN